MSMTRVLVRAIVESIIWENDFNIFGADDFSSSGNEGLELGGGDSRWEDHWIAWLGGAVTVAGRHLEGCAVGMEV